ncbi:MAG: tetratricopeptide repeat protein [Myxococcales bacterium]|jgi:tetratricopeptide (TPR) repeat protein|nr:tetratricopeptide repeat protein [Myxococcales bacterium]
MSGDDFSACEEGIERLAEGDVEGAIEELTRVIAEDPKNEHAYFFLGQAYYEERSYEKALAAYVKALELAPDYLGAMIGAGQTLRLLGQHERALRMGREILKRRKDDPDALYLMGLVHFQRGEVDASRGYLERFLQTSPEIEVALEVEGILQVLRGEATITDGDVEA